MFLYFWHMLSNLVYFSWTSSRLKMWHDFLQQFNKQLKLNHLHFICNIGCFCSVSAAKIVPNKNHNRTTAHVTRTLNLFSLLNDSAFWTNRLSQRFNDLFINICLILEWIVWMNESMTHSLWRSPAAPPTGGLVLNV